MCCFKLESYPSPFPQKILWIKSTSPTMLSLQKFQFNFKPCSWSLSKKSIDVTTQETGSAVTEEALIPMMIKKRIKEVRWVITKLGQPKIVNFVNNNLQVNLIKKATLKRNQVSASLFVVCSSNKLYYSLNGLHMLEEDRI